EFLLESAFLCIVGGLIGMAAVFVLTVIFSAMLDFHVFIPLNIIGLAVLMCLFTGVLAGIIPAFVAASRDGWMLSNVIAAQKVHEQYGGVVPELASRAHIQHIVPVVDAALKKAGCE